VQGHGHLKAEEGDDALDIELEDDGDDVADEAENEREDTAEDPADKRKHGAEQGEDRLAIRIVRSMLWHRRGERRTQAGRAQRQHR
jgi:hypothetical protein